MLLVNGWVKFVEVDSYARGVIESANGHSGKDSFKAENITELLGKLKAFTEHNDVLWNSCEEPGRIDIQGLENEYGYLATETELQQWKDGQIDLYSVTYTFNVLECTPYHISEVLK